MESPRALFPLCGSPWYCAGRAGLNQEPYGMSKPAEQWWTALAPSGGAIHAVAASEVREPTGRGFGARYRAACGRAMMQVTVGQPFVAQTESGTHANCMRCSQVVA